MKKKIYGIVLINIMAMAARGITKALGYDELPISPKTWQKTFGIVCPKEIKKKEHRKKWLKEKSLEVARKKFPDWEMRLSKPTAHGLS